VELAGLIVSLASDGALGRATVEDALRSGAARQGFRRMIEAQGGNTLAFDDRRQLPSARLHRTVSAETDGYLSRLDALTLAHASIALGAGRERKGEPIDLSVGLVLAAKVGDRVTRGGPLLTLHANDEQRLNQAERLARTAIEVSPRPVEPPPLILERLVAAAAPPRG
jgi:pyrimidine-nucleoside phosphorylase